MLFSISLCVSQSRSAGVFPSQNPNLMEEIAVAAPTNATPQVPGAGSDVAHWKPIKDRKKRKEILYIFKDNVK